METNLTVNLLTNPGGNTKSEARAWGERQPGVIEVLSVRRQCNLWTVWVRLQK